MTKDTAIEKKLHVRLDRTVTLENYVTQDNKIEPGYVEGWASTELLDCFGTIFRAGAFRKSIDKRGISGPSGIKFMINHDREKPAGKIETLEYRNNRLFIAARFGLSISYVKDFYEAAKMQGGFNFSIGARILDYEEGGENEKTGGPVFYINEADLYEVSAVPFPGNEECVMTSLRTDDTQAIATVSDFEKYLVSLGIVRSRRDANKITKTIKRNPDLFRINNSVRDDRVNTQKPVLAESDIADLSNRIANIRSLLENGPALA